MRWIEWSTLMLVLATATATATAQAGVLDRARETRTIRLGYRLDAQPFSFTDPAGLPAGYSVALCTAVVGAVKAAVGQPELKVEWKLVGTEDRFAALARGDVDLLCSADSVTLGRRAEVDFSLFTFATGETLLYRANGPHDFAGLAGHKVGVRAGTNSEDALRKALAGAHLGAIEVVGVPSHADGIERLAKGEFAAYFGDGAILLWQWLQSPSRADLKIAERTFSIEPYALPLPKGDDEFRLLVDRTLAKLYRSGEIAGIFDATFKGAEPSPLVQAVYRLNGLAD